MTPHQIVNRFTTPHLKVLATLNSISSITTAHMTTTAQVPALTHSENRAAKESHHLIPSFTLPHHIADNLSHNPDTSHSSNDSQTIAGVKLCEAVVIQLFSHAQRFDRKKIAEQTRTIRDMQVEAAIMRLEADITHLGTVVDDLGLIVHLDEAFKELPSRMGEAVESELAKTRRLAREERVTLLRNIVQSAENKVVRGILDVILARKG